MNMISRFCFTGLLLVCVLGLTACKEKHEDVEYIARVGERLLTQDDLGPMFEVFPAGQDSSEAMEQIAEEWVKNELIAQEAIRRGLRNDLEVLRLLEENERSVLVSTFISRLFQQEPLDPSPEEIEAYYAKNVEQLALREDYIRVRYLSSRDAIEAEQARLLLRDATVAGKADSLWPSLIDRYALDPNASAMLSNTFYPRSVLFPSAQLREMVARLNVNQISPVIQEGVNYHFVQVVERRVAGAVPELTWIEAELKQRLTIEARKQMLARQVQRLRTEALAREDLEIKYLND
ncbi:MAG: peptidyl-prolyl cis-trans isomerase [Bacteroidota bacterium]